MQTEDLSGSGVRFRGPTSMKTKMKPSLLRQMISTPEQFWDYLTDQINAHYDGLEMFTSLSLSFLLNLTAFYVIAFVGAFYTQLLAFGGLITFSLFNSYRFFNHTKPYQLLTTSPEDLRDKPNLEVSTLPIFSQDATIAAEREVAILHVWQPTYFTRTVFKFASPVTVACWFFGANSISVGSRLLALLLVSLSIWTVWSLLSRYEQLLDDTRLIAGEAYEENNQFALSRLAVFKKDAATQTETGNNYRYHSAYSAYRPVGTPNTRPGGFYQPPQPLPSLRPDDVQYHTARTYGAVPSYSTAPMVDRGAMSTTTTTTNSGWGYNTLDRRSPGPLQPATIPIRPLTPVNPPAQPSAPDLEGMDVEEDPLFPSQRPPVRAAPSFFTEATSPQYNTQRDRYSPGNLGGSPPPTSGPGDAPPMQSLSSLSFM